MIPFVYEGDCHTHLRFARNDKTISQRHHSSLCEATPKQSPTQLLLATTIIGHAYARRQEIATLTFGSFATTRQSRNDNTISQQLQYNDKIKT